MNILRKTRKSNIKISRRRLVLLIFTLIMASFAWIAYFRILKTNFEVHINSWNISLFIDKNQNGVAEQDEEQDKDEVIEVDFLEMYPGMNQEVVDVIIKNNGETLSTIDYIISDIKFLGDDYALVDDINAALAENPNGFFLKNNEKTESGGIYTYNLIDDTDFPFKFIIEHPNQIEGGAEGHLKVKALWVSSLENEDELTEEQINEKNDIDSDWGYRVANFIEENPDLKALQFKLKINATGLARSSRFVLTQNLEPDDYGAFIDYPIDLNEDGKITNDWRILYEDNENVYIIPDKYVPNSMISEEIFEKGTENYSVFTATFKTDALAENNSIQQALINKYMFSSALANNNMNYAATSKLLNPDYWTAFVDSNYAESAIGAPTIEMLVRSWNQKYIESENYQQLDVHWSIKGNGYKINKENEIEITDYEDAKLYFPYTTSDNLDETENGDCNGYWIASPSANNEKSLLNILCSGKISYSEIDDVNSGLGFRPVVCLKKEIKGSYDESKAIWNFD